MKKKLIGISILSAALTVSVSVPAFAGWIREGESWAYEYANGSRPKNANWFTDPDTGLEYYIDPDGHIMTGTYVEGYWLDDSGVKHEKSEAQIALEKEREQRNANRKSPGKTHANIQETATAAKTAGIASSTTRRVYQAEMKSLMDSILADSFKQIGNLGNSSIQKSIVNNNVETTYGLKAENGLMIISSTLWNSSNKSNTNYVPYAFELHYNRGIISDSDLSAILNDTFKKLLVASLGESEGNAMYERIMAEEVGSQEKLSGNGASDTGNPYEMSYRTNNANIKVTCSEILPPAEEETSAEENAEGEETTAGGTAEGQPQETEASTEAAE